MLGSNYFYSKTTVSGSSSLQNGALLPLFLLLVIAPAYQRVGRCEWAAGVQS